MRKRSLLPIAPILLLIGLLSTGWGDVPESEEANTASPVLLRPFNKMMVLEGRLNVITDSTHSLDPFYGQLADLRAARTDDGTKRVSILHVGDSHIQAGFLTGAIMRNFHRDFGNAGLGLVTPLRMARTNEPSDYVIRSNRTWESSQVVQSRRVWPIGVGGVSIATRSALFTLSVSALEKNESEDYAFNRVRVLKHPAAPQLQVADPEVRDSVRLVADENPYSQTIELDSLLSEVTLSGRAGARRDSSIYFGFSLENGHNGVLYHSVGINGAQFMHWRRIEGWSEQVRALEPTLIILSMGTNESLEGDRFSASRFEAQIDSVVIGLREKNPEALFLLTTPADSYRSRRVNRQTVYSPNPTVEAVSAVIRNYAARHGLACWDLFTASGGDGSREMWWDEELLSRDHLHFSAEGYEVLAHHLYHALIKGYNQYVRDRHTEPAPHP
jgi:lysophospholipase L1-like esterase